MVSDPPWKQWEDEWAERTGGTVVPASGSTFHSKLDVKGHGVLWSAKYTKHRSYPISQDDLREVERAIVGSGGLGSGVIGAMAIRIGGPEFDVVVLRAEDFLRIVKDNLSLVTESRSERKRERARTPILFRDEGEE